MNTVNEVQESIKIAYAADVNRCNFNKIKLKMKTKMEVPETSYKFTTIILEFLF